MLTARSLRGKWRWSVGGGSLKHLLLVFVFDHIAVQQFIPILYLAEDYCKPLLLKHWFYESINGNIVCKTS